jgi:hypothetical protein
VFGYAERVEDLAGVRTAFGEGPQGADPAVI